MGSTRNTPGSAEDRRARIQRMRASEQARERRNRLLFIGVSTLIVVGLIGGGGYLYLQKADEKEQTEAAEKAQAEKPVKGEKSWKAEELGRDHVSTPVSYPMTPPVGGDHNQVWMNCDGDVYEKAIPEVNATANQVKKDISGFASLPPSLILPYLLNPAQRQKATRNVDPRA